MTLQFVLTEIVARLVAIYLRFDGTGVLKRAFATRKVEYIETDLINILLGLSNYMADRDTMSFRYWAIVTGTTTSVACCAVVAIFGWWVPNG